MGVRARASGDPDGPNVCEQDITDGALVDIDQVLTGDLDLSEAINTSIEGAVCDPYEPVG